jgi:hypothetical protein
MVFASSAFRLVVVAAVLLASTRSVPAADAKPAKGEPAAQEPKAAKQDSRAKAERERPACMHCGATCGLVPVCICMPGTRKIQKTEYETTCDPVCVPCCSGPPWKCQRRATSCTGCEAECHDAWVRQRKKLVAEQKDEERPTIERKVVWVCRGCDAGPSAGCTDGGDAASRRAGWWPSWLPHP